MAVYSSCDKKSKITILAFPLGKCRFVCVCFVGFKDVFTQPMANIVAALAGIIGKMTGVFEPYYKYGIIFVQSAKDSITLKIDFDAQELLRLRHFYHFLYFSVYYKI